MTPRKLFITTTLETKERTERVIPAMCWTHSGIENLAAAAAVPTFLKVINAFLNSSKSRDFEGGEERKERATLVSKQGLFLYQKIHHREKNNG